MVEKTILQLHNALEQGKTTVREITQAFLDRVKALDKQGPKLNAVIELNPEALSIADALDAECEQKGMRGMLHGIPVMLKDNIDTGDQMQTTAGSLALSGSIAKEDATLVRNLRRAGAVILGKTNLSEWAGFRSSQRSSGWSSR